MCVTVRLYLDLCAYDFVIIWPSFWGHHRGRAFTGCQHIEPGKLIRHLQW